MHGEGKYAGGVAPIDNRNTGRNQPLAASNRVLSPDLRDPIQLPFTFPVTLQPFNAPDGTTVNVPGFPDGRYMSVFEMDPQTLDALVLTLLTAIYGTADKPNPWSHSGYDKPAPARG